MQHVLLLRALAYCAVGLMPAAKQRPPTAIDGEATLIESMRHALEAKLRHDEEKGGQASSAEQEERGAEPSDATAPAWLVHTRKVCTYAWSEQAVTRAAARAMVWKGSGEKISTGEIKSALREAARQVEEAAEARAAAIAEAEAAKLRNANRPTARVLEACGPNVRLDETCAVECRASGRGLSEASTRQPAEFLIEAYDAAGRRQQQGGDAFFVTVRGVQKVRARVVDNGDGSYAVSWTPPQSGFYSIAVSCFGLSIPGSPFTVTATQPLPWAPNCVVSGEALSRAVARKTHSFEVSFKDRLGYTTHAVDLDVYVEAVAPALRDAAAVAASVDAPEEMPLPSQAPVPDGEGHSASAFDVAEDGADTGADASAGGGAAEDAKSVQQQQQQQQQQGAREGSTKHARFETPKSERRASAAADASLASSRSPPQDVKRRVIRIRAKCPLVIRASQAVNSEQIGVVRQGQYVTVVMEKQVEGRTRAMIALGSISGSEVAETLPNKSSTPAEANGSSGSDASTTASATVADPPQQPPGQAAPSESQPAAAAPAGEEAISIGQHAGRDVEAAQEGVNERGLPAGSSSSAPSPAASPPSPATSHGGKIGWVTLVKDGKKLVTSRVRQSAGARQLGRDQWARRLATDRAMTAVRRGTVEASADKSTPKKSAAKQSALAKEKDLIAPKVSLELSADPTGTGFAFGGLYPGTLHARGKIFETHSVSYSIGIVGEYLMHVRLRQQAAALPGSPFRLTVLPSLAHARSCRLPLAEMNGGIVGLVGAAADRNAGTSMTFATFDLIGNRCVEGGAKITSQVLDKAQESNVEVVVTDNMDGTYTVRWTCVRREANSGPCASRHALLTSHRRSLVRAGPS